MQLRLSTSSLLLLAWSFPSARSFSPKCPLLVVGSQDTRCYPILSASSGSQESPSFGLYEVQEEVITRRGQLEEDIMADASTSELEANKVKGAGSAGGFGGGGGGGKSSSSQQIQGKEHAKVLQKDGVVRIDNVLTEKNADNLRKFVFDLRTEALESVERGDIPQQQRFADVLLRKNRSDLTMPLGPEEVYLGLHDVLCQSPVGKAMEALLGKDAVLYELSCLISDPGSDRQVVHPDTPCSKSEEQAVLYTCFIALQDITLDMGPTVWLPNTHTKDIHDILKEETEPSTGGESPKDALLRRQPAKLGTLKKGCCAIFDSRLLHCGTANRGTQSRALFYFSFKNPAISYPGNPASIRPELADQLTLSILMKELASYKKGKKYETLTRLESLLK